jgi:hypothetical protein
MEFRHGASASSRKLAMVFVDGTRVDYRWIHQTELPIGGHKLCMALGLVYWMSA